MNAGGGNNSLPSLPPESKDIGLMFEMGIDLDLLVPENEVDRLETYTEKFKQEITALFPQFKVEVTEVPKTDTATKFEPVTDEMDDQVKKVQIKEFPAKVKISGFIGGDNES